MEAQSLTERKAEKEGQTETEIRKTLTEVREVKGRGRKRGWERQ